MRFPNLGISTFTTCKMLLQISFQVTIYLSFYRSFIYHYSVGGLQRCFPPGVVCDSDEEF